MEMRGISGGFYSICEWIMKLAYVQFLWFVFTIAGAVFLGAFPATSALFSVIRKWVMGKKDISIYPTFKSAYKKDFWKINGLGWLLAAIGFILLVDLMIFKFGESGISTIIRFIILSLLIIYGLTVLFFFPVYVHFSFSFKDYIKNSFLFSLASPSLTVVIIIGYFILYKILAFLPGLIPFFSIAVYAFLSMWCSFKVFQRMTSQH
ncbi:YesL family protein [Bacillus pinisoli]|uniref:YesL family protein n=1 Tax=Bacillus pinisoli TaxID=2901866 RepID=UPI001FF20949|nr:YesL family protein [Bacillus pinisoli]